MWMDSGYLGGVSVHIDSKKWDWEPPSGICPKIAFRWNIGTDLDLAVYIIINE